MNLSDYFKECQTLVNQSLETFLPPATTYPPILHEAMRYSLLAGGKRIRPILAIAAAEACGGSRREVLPIACAIEMIHAFSLIHDDLPAMDDDDLRRGQPTNHKVYGEAIAILAGDALYGQAFEVLTKLKSQHKDPMMILEIISDIVRGSGALGMIGGQVIDIQAEGKKISLEELKRLHSYKTGHLIRVSVTSGAKIVTDDAQKLACLERYAELIGLAFQIADDILDIEGGEEIGKDLGSDVERGKSTYPALMGLEESKKEAKKVLEEALTSLKSFGEEADVLREIAQYIVERKK